jgi:hypothetical protein
MIDIIKSETGLVFRRIEPAALSDVPQEKFPREEYGEELRRRTRKLAEKSRQAP